jgi:hypothetical protein
MKTYEVEIKLLDELRFKGSFEEYNKDKVKCKIHTDKDSYTELFEDLFYGKREIAYVPAVNGELSYKTYRKPFADLKELFDFLIDEGFELTYKEIK